jgi:hypothetical protein
MVCLLTRFFNATYNASLVIGVKPVRPRVVNLILNWGGGGFNESYFFLSFRKEISRMISCFLYYILMMKMMMMALKTLVRLQGVIT